MFKALVTTGLVASLLSAVAPIAAYASGEVNLYSSRHYDTDERLYSEFEEATGIKVNRIEGKADDLIERMKAEGANSPADVFITVDASRTWRADQAGLFQPVVSETLEMKIPSYLRHDGGHWFSHNGHVFSSTTKIKCPSRRKLMQTSRTPNIRAKFACVLAPMFIPRPYFLPLLKTKAKMQRKHGQRVC